MPRFRRLLPVLPILALILTDCAPGMRISRFRPARYNLGATRKLALLNVRGPAEATGVVAAELAEQIVSKGVFELYSRVPQSVEIVIIPGRDVVQNIERVRDLVPTEAYIAADVARWEYTEREIEEKVKENDQEVKKKFRVPHAGVAVNFQVIEATSGRLVVLREYTAGQDGQKFEPGKPGPKQADLLRSACSDVVGSFLYDITPRWVTEKIVLDEVDPALKDGVELCKRGMLDEAASSFRNVLQTYPGSSGATYNLGVLAEVSGDHALAEEYYRKAIDIDPKPLYQKALQNLQRRVAEEEALKERL
ncbi:MAG: tetratricopeptide repeat protein [Acidobacteriota bacterium]